MLASNGPVVNKNVWSIVDLEKKKRYSKGLKYRYLQHPCTAYAHAHAFQKGLQELGEECSDMIIFYRFFNGCSARCDDFSQCRLKVKALVI